MGIRKLVFLWIITLAGFIGGCAIPFTPALTTKSEPAPGMAYLYGRFTLRQVLLAGIPPQMGILVQGNTPESSYRIELLPQGSISVIAVKPGAYALKKLIYNYGGDSQEEKPLPDSLQTTEFRVESGKAYYLGDFYATTTTERTGSGVHVTWRLDSMTDNFQKSTDDFKRIFPHFRDVPAMPAGKLSKSSAEVKLDDLKALLPTQQDSSKRLNELRDLLPGN